MPARRALVALAVISVFALSGDRGDANPSPQDAEEKLGAALSLTDTASIRIAAKLYGEPDINAEVLAKCRLARPCGSSARQSAG